MNKQIINTTNAPDPIGPYSQAVKAAGLLFISGQVAIKTRHFKPYYRYDMRRNRTGYE